MAVGFLDLHSWIVVVGTFCVPPRLSTACCPLLIGVGFFTAVKLVPFVRLVLVTVRSRRINLILNMMKFWCDMAVTVRTVAMCIAYARWWIAPVTTSTCYFPGQQHHKRYIQEYTTVKRNGCTVTKPHYFGSYTLAKDVVLFFWCR